MCWVRRPKILAQWSPKDQGPLLWAQQLSLAGQQQAASPSCQGTQMANKLSSPAGCKPRGIGPNSASIAWLALARPVPCMKGCPLRTRLRHPRQARTYDPIRDQSYPLAVRSTAPIRPTRQDPRSPASSAAIAFGTGNHHHVRPHHVGARFRPTHPPRALCFDQRTRVLSGLMQMSLQHGSLPADVFVHLPASSYWNPTGPQARLLVAMPSRSRGHLLLLGCNPMVACGYPMQAKDTRTVATPSFASLPLLCW